MDSMPNLSALAVFVAVIDEGSLGAASRRLDIHQPNASRMVAELEREAGMSLLERHPRGSRPTAAGLLFAAHARDLLQSANEFNQWLWHRQRDDVIEFSVGASITIAEHLLPLWLAGLRRRNPQVRVAPTVLNSVQILDEVQGGALHLGFIETPRIPGSVNTQVVRHDELAVVTAPIHPWARRSAPLELDELVTTPLVVREGGSGTRDAFEELVDQASLAEPTQVLASNAAVRVAVAAGVGPAVLSMLTVRPQLESGELVAIPLRGVHLRRPLTAVWTGPRRLTGPAADLLAIASQP